MSDQYVNVDEKIPEPDAPSGLTHELEQSVSDALAAPEAPRRASPLQVEINRASDQCAAYSGLCRRLEKALEALRGPSSHNERPEPRPRAPKEVSLVAGIKLINDGNASILVDIGRAVDEFEALLACGS